MASSDISTDLTLGVLSPTSAVRGVGGQSPKQDSGENSRRHSPSAPEADENPELPEASEESQHQLDRLA